MNMIQKILTGVAIGLMTLPLFGQRPNSPLVLGWDGQYITEIPSEIILNPIEVNHLHKIAQLPEQKRTRLYVSPVLCAAAKIKAMAGSAEHYDLEGKVIMERMGLGGVELLGGCVSNLASEIGTTHDEAINGDDKYISSIYVGVGGVEGGGAGAVVMFSASAGTTYRGKTIRAYMPDGTPIPSDWNLMEWGNINRPAGQSLVCPVKAHSGDVSGLLVINRDGGRLVSPWLGYFNPVGGNFIKSNDMGLVKLYPESGWYGNVPYGWETEFAYTENLYGVFDIGRGDLWNRTGNYGERYDYDSPRLPFLSYGVRETYWGPSGYSNFDSESSYKQGFWIETPMLGWVWTHPLAYPNAWVQAENRWVKLNAIRPQGGYVQMMVSDRQAYVGDTVVFAWDSNLDGTRFEGAGMAYNQPTGAVAVTLTREGETVAVVNAGGVADSKTVYTFPKPKNPAVWIDAHPKVVQVGEPFLIAWNSSGGVPIVEAESHGIFSNEATGQVHFSRQIPADYTFKVRLGDAVQTVTVRVEGQMHRSETTSTWFLRQQ